MSRRPATIWFFCVIFVAAGCASTPAPEPQASSPAPQPAKTEAPKRPEYHAESDAVSFGREESRAFAELGCAQAEAPEKCMRRAGRTLRGYRGSFSKPGADEVLVALDDTTVLLARTGERWTATARAPQVAIDNCLVAKPAGSDASTDLVCRAAAADDWGFGLAFFHLSAHEDGQLTAHTLETPHATDLDTTLFAGWKHEADRIEVRLHKETKVQGASQINFDGPNACRFRTFAYRPGPEPELVEVDGCQPPTTPAADDTQSKGSQRTAAQYDGELHDPIMARNRDYVMCYQRELERLEKLEEVEASEASEVTEASKEAEAPGETEAEDKPREPLAGEAHARFVIGSSGTPVSCQITKSTLDNPNVERCLCREIMATPFPPVPQGKFVDVTYPFRFAPPR